MIEFKLWQGPPSWFPPEIPHQLMMTVLTRQKRMGVWGQASANPHPTSSIWEGLTGCEKFNDSTYVLYKGSQAMKLEKIPPGGKIHWRLTVGDELNAIVFGMVEGNPAVDICSANPCVKAYAIDDGQTVVIENHTEYNGIHWSLANITELKHPNVHHGIHSVKDGDYGSTAYIGNDDTLDWNQASSGRREGVIISYGHGARPVLENDEGRDLQAMIADGFCDYVITPEDILDADKERYSITLVPAWKRYLGSLHIPLEQLPFNFNPSKK